MKITFLGTSHGDATLTRYQSSTLLETGGKYYLIDAGEPVSASLIRRGIIPSQITAIFLTHMHIDHVGGLPNLVSQADKYRHHQPGIRLQAYLPDERAVPAFQSWYEVNHSGRFAGASVIHAYAAGTFYDDGNLKATAFPTRHLTTSRSNSFLIEAEGLRVFFTGDLSNDYSDFNLEAADGCDLVCSELTHFPLEKALPILKKLSAGKLIFYHLHNPWQTGEGAGRALEACKAAGLPYPVRLAFDGMETELISVPECV